MHIWDRHGTSVDVIDLPGRCVGMDWSNDGGLLAIIDDKTSNVILWDANTKRRSEVNTMEKSQLTFLLWSKLGLTLSIGSAKGNLVLYNHQTGRKIPILGKHNNKVNEPCRASMRGENGTGGRGSFILMRPWYPTYNGLSACRPVANIASLLTLRRNRPYPRLAGSRSPAVPGATRTPSASVARITPSASRTRMATRFSSPSSTASPPTSSSTRPRTTRTSRQSRSSSTTRPFTCGRASSLRTPSSSSSR